MAIVRAKARAVKAQTIKNQAIRVALLQCEARENSLLTSAELDAISELCDLLELSARVERDRRRVSAVFVRITTQLELWVSQ
jgi:hypothetical protein